MISTPPPPRRLSPGDRVRLLRGRFGESGFFGMFFAGMGMIFVFVFVVFGRTFPGLFLLAADSHAVGTVLSVEGTSASENESPVYRNNFTFRAADDREYEQYSFTTGDHFHEGQQVEIVYLSGNPRLAVIKNARFSTFDPFVLFTVIFPAVGFVLMFRGRPRHVLRFFHHLRHGVTAPGKVIAKRPARLRAWLEYEYAVGTGFERGRVLHPNNYDYKVGDDCLVLHGPRPGGTSTLLGNNVRYIHGRWQSRMGNSDTIWASLLPMAGYYGLWAVLLAAVLIVASQFL